MIISGAESFFLQGGVHGVLLVHGFTGSPAELLLLGKYLQSKNFTVLGMRLAGHGTNESDLLRTTKVDWFNSVLDGYAILNGCCEKISVVGHSMGALLSLKLATLPSIQIYKIVSLAAPIFINEALGLKRLPPREIVKNHCVHKARRRLKNVPYAANHTYSKMPFISIHELVDIIEDSKKILNKINTPALIVHGKNDHTANVESANFIFDNISSKERKLLLIEHAGHLLPLDESREEVFKLTADFLER